MDTQPREEMPNVKAITTATLTIEKDANQHFCCTPKAWELWQTEPARRIQRWPRSRIFWVIED